MGSITMVTTLHTWTAFEKVSLTWATALHCTCTVCFHSNELSAQCDCKSLFTFTMTSKLGCDDFICNIVYSLMS